MTSHNSTYSLFPLHTVLYPGSILHLKIFEQRYLKLIKSCMKNSHGFIVVLINHGNEVNDTPTVYCMGTYVEIIDFETLNDGLLGITIRAQHKVHIKNTKAEHDGLLHGEAETIIENDSDNDTLINKYQHLKDMLITLVEHPLIKEQYTNINYQSSDRKSVV